MNRSRKNRKQHRGPLAGIALTGVFLAGALLVEARLAQRPDEEPPGKTSPPVQGRKPEGALETPVRPQPETRTDSLLLPREGERPRLEPDSLYQMGGVQVRLHRDDKAIAIYERLVAENPDHHLADEALWQAAKAAERRSDFTRARLLFNRLVDRYPDSPMRDEARWSAAFMLYCAERYQESLQSFRRVGAQTSEPHLIDQSLFWAGKSARHLGLEGEAGALFQRAADNFPRSYYSARAVSMGYHGEAGEGGWSHPHPEPDAALTWDQVREAAREAGVDPFLVLAVIRQESRFEDQAESHAGALGVMQIMPRTARSLAEEVGMGAFEKDQLSDPAVSIRMGSRYLGEQIRCFASGATREVGFELGLAAYNAGPRAARQWVRRFPVDDPDAFVERIPYKETRIYVKKVLKNYTVYKTALSSA